MEFNGYPTPDGVSTKVARVYAYRPGREGITVERTDGRTTPSSPPPGTGSDSTSKKKVTQSGVPGHADRRRPDRVSLGEKGGGRG